MSSSSFRVDLCVASALPSRGFLMCASFRSFATVFVFLSWQHAPREEKDLSKHLSLCHQARMTKAPIRTIGGNLGRWGVFKRMKAARKHLSLLITSALSLSKHKTSSSEKKKKSTHCIASFRKTKQWKGKTKENKKHSKFSLSQGEEAELFSMNAYSQGCSP